MSQTHQTEPAQTPNNASTRSGTSDRTRAQLCRSGRPNDVLPGTFGALLCARTVCAIFEASLCQGVLGVGVRSARSALVTGLLVGRSVVFGFGSD